MAARQGYNLATGNAPRPDAQDFVPGSSYYTFTGPQMQDAFLNYVDHSALSVHPSVSCAPPAAMMLAPHTQPFAGRELPCTLETTASALDQRRLYSEHPSVSAVATDVDGRVTPQPPPPPTLENVQNLRCPSPSLPQVKGDVEAIHDRLARIGNRVDSIESRHNELVVFCESFSSWSGNVLTYYEKLNKKIDAQEEKLRQATGLNGEELAN